MKFTATNVLPGDIIRGVGLLVEEVDPLTDTTTRLYGKVSTRNPDWDGVSEGADGKYLNHNAIIEVPNDHLLNVRRSDEAFRADRIRLLTEAVDRFRDGDGEDPEQGSTAWDLFLSRVFRIGRMPRGRKYHLQPESVEDVAEAIEWDDVNVEALLDAVDARDVPDPDDESQSGAILGLVVLG